MVVSYALEDIFVDCTVTSPGGGSVPDAHHPLVACNIHKTEEIESAYEGWLSRDAEAEDEHDSERDYCEFSALIR